MIVTIKPGWNFFHRRLKWLATRFKLLTHFAICEAKGVIVICLPLNRAFGIVLGLVRIFVCGVGGEFVVGMSRDIGGHVFQLGKSATLYRIDVAGIEAIIGARLMPLIFEPLLLSIRKALSVRALRFLRDAFPPIVGPIARAHARPRVARP